MMQLCLCINKFMAGYVSPSEASKILGVSSQTLRRWAKSGKIDNIRSPNGHYRYKIDSLIQADRKKKTDIPQKASQLLPKKAKQDNPFILSFPNHPEHQILPRYQYLDPFLYKPTYTSSPWSPGIRIPTEKLINFANTIPVRKAISRIANGVSGMHWSIFPKSSIISSKKKNKMAMLIEENIIKLNSERVGNYYSWVECLVTDLIVFNYTAVERREHFNDKNRFFDIWPACTKNIREDPTWTSDQAKTQIRFYDTGGLSDHRDWKGFLDSEMFITQKHYNSWDYVPLSTLEVAYGMIEMWLGITEQQQRTTSKSFKRTILNLGERISQQELDAFRQYWQSSVVNTGEIPILSGSQLNTVDLGAKNDEELYIKYVEYLLKIIAITFGLTYRDMGLTDHDNRATAGVAADSTFADAILPYARIIESIINKEILDFFPSTRGYYFEFTNKEPRNEQAEAQRAALLFNGKIITRDEARAMVGLDAIDSGELFIDGSDPKNMPPPEPPKKDYHNSPHSNMPRLPQQN